MALSNLVAASICVSFLLLHLSDAVFPTPEKKGMRKTMTEVKQERMKQFEKSYPLPISRKIDCNGACEGRCSKASRHKECERACETCCIRCNCVPPGTSGNQQECPCYYNETTHGGTRKCP